MHELLDLVKKWPNEFGQALFLLIIFSSALYSISYCFYVVGCVIRKCQPKPPLQ